MLRLAGHAVLGSTLFHQGEYANAWSHLEQCIALTDPTAQWALALRQGDAPGVGGLAHAAPTLWCLGYPAQAMQRSQEALALALELAHPYSLAVTQFWAAYLHHRRREAPAAQAQTEALLTLATAQGFSLYVRRRIGSRANSSRGKRCQMNPRRKPTFSRPSPWLAASRRNRWSCGPP